MKTYKLTWDRDSVDTVVAFSSSDTLVGDVTYVSRAGAYRATYGPVTKPIAVKWFNTQIPAQAWIAEQHRIYGYCDGYRPLEAVTDGN